MGNVVDNCCGEMDFLTWTVWLLGIILLALLTRWLFIKKRKLK